MKLQLIRHQLRVKDRPHIGNLAKRASFLKRCRPIMVQIGLWHAATSRHNRTDRSRASIRKRELQHIGRASSLTSKSSRVILTPQERNKKRRTRTSTSQSPFLSMIRVLTLLPPAWPSALCTQIARTCSE